MPVSLNENTYNVKNENLHIINISTYIYMRILLKLNIYSKYRTAVERKLLRHDLPD